MRFTHFLVFLACAAALLPAHAQSGVKTAGTLVIVPAYGEVTLPNDEARATFTIEEQDKDKAAAASRVNMKMKQGVDVIRAGDPQAKLKTHGYYTYPVYADEPAPPRPTGTTRPRQPVGWRVGQYLEMKTLNLADLPKTVAAAQKILALNGLQFGLSEAATAKLDSQRIEASYRNLNERVAAIAKAMGRSPADAVLETVDFEASGAYAPQADMMQAKSMRTTAFKESQAVEEPSFEPGETSLQMRVVGRVKFK
nr:SIMPL domain-containing protein [Paucimonas lemoignei]